MFTHALMHTHRHTQTDRERESEKVNSKLSWWRNIMLMIHSNASGLLLSLTSYLLSRKPSSFSFLLCFRNIPSHFLNWFSLWMRMLTTLLIQQTFIRQIIAYIKSPPKSPDADRCPFNVGHFFDLLTWSTIFFLHLVSVTWTQLQKSDNNTVNTLVKYQIIK